MRTRPARVKKIPRTGPNSADSPDGVGVPMTAPSRHSGEARAGVAGEVIYTLNRVPVATAMLPSSGATLAHRFQKAALPSKLPVCGAAMPPSRAAS